MVNVVEHNTDKGWEICIIADNDMDIVKYLIATDDIQFDVERFHQDMGMKIIDWLEQGHRIDELNDWINNETYYIEVYALGYDYKEDSPYYLKDIDLYVDGVDV